MNDRTPAQWRTRFGDNGNLDRLTTLASAALGAPAAQINVITDERQVSVSSVGPARWNEREALLLESSFCRHVVEAGHPLLVGDARADVRLRHNPAAIERGVSAYAGAPVPTGEIDATICVIDFKPRIWQPADADLLADLASLVATEVRRRTDVEAAAREGDRRFRSLIRHAPDLIFILNPDGTVQYQSPSVEAALGYSPDELAENVFWPIHSEDRESVLSALTEVMSEPERSVVLQFRYQHKDGAWHTYESTATNLLHDPAVRGIVVNSRDVSERADAEATVRESEARFRQLAENLDQVFALADTSRGEFLYVSPAYDRILGRSREELYQNPAAWMEAVHPDDRSRVRSSLPLSKTLGYEIEYRIIRPDGEIRRVRDRGFPVRRGEAGEFRRASVTEDVTAHHIAQERLRESEETYRSLFDSISEMVYVQSFDGAFLTVNRAVEERYGYSRNDLIGATPEALVDPSLTDMEEVRPRFQKAIDGEPQRFEFWARTRSGERFPKEVSLSRGRYFGDDVIIAVARDISEQKRTQEALVRSRDFYLSVLDRFPALVWRTTPDGQCDYFNQTWLEFTGADAGGDLSDLWLSTVHPEDRDLCATTFRESYQRRQAFEIEYRLRHHSGEHRWVVTAGRPLHGLDEEFLGYVAAGFERHEERRLEEQLRIAQRMESLGRLAGGIAHDFNNILSVIGGTAEFLIMDTPEEGELYDDLLEIRKAAQRAAGLTGQLLAFSRQQVVQPKAIDLNDVVVQTEQMLRRTLGADVEFVTLLAEDLGQIEADPVQVEQVLMNLAVNARDAMPDGGRLLTETANVEVGHSRPGNGAEILPPGRYVMLRMSDSGAGMPLEVRERIFDPFFTTKERGRGTGLGLATVYGIVKQSGGQITVESAEGEGTTFEIHFPRLETASPERAPKAPPVSVKAGTGTVLVVEDEAPLRSVLRRSLERAGYTVIEAGNGEEALRIMDDGAPVDLLVTDLVMPLLGGAELAEQVSDRRPDLPVLFISGYPSEDLQTKKDLPKGAHTLRKPFSPAELVQATHEILGGRESGRG